MSWEAAASPLVSSQPDLNHLLELAASNPKQLFTRRNGSIATKPLHMSMDELLRSKLEDSKRLREEAGDEVSPSERGMALYESYIAFVSGDAAAMDSLLAAPDVRSFVDWQHWDDGCEAFFLSTPPSASPAAAACSVWRKEKLIHRLCHS